MNSAIRFLLDEHVSRVFETVLHERGYRVEQAKDVLGEGTNDEKLLRWCAKNNVLVISNNTTDFERLHPTIDHAGIFLYSETNLDYAEPEGIAQTVDIVIDQFGPDELANSIIYLEQWYNWINESNE